MNDDNTTQDMCACRETRQVPNVFVLVGTCIGRLDFIIFERAWTGMVDCHTCTDAPGTWPLPQDVPTQGEQDGNGHWNESGQNKKVEHNSKTERREQEQAAKGNETKWEKLEEEKKWDLHEAEMKKTRPLNSRPLL